MKILIAGSGAMGSTYGSMLKMAGNDVDFVDMWDENLKAVNERGIYLNNLGKKEVIETKMYLPEEYNKKVDLVIVFTKSMQLREMLTRVKHIIDDNTHVLCLLNGLGHMDTLKEFFKEDNVIMGVTVLTAALHGPGNFEVSGYGKTELQNIGAGGEEFTKKVVELFNKSGLVAEYANNILFSIWRKACLNGTMNSCCALLDCNMYELGQTPNSRELLGNIVKEFASVAKKVGVDLDVEDITNYVYWFTTEEFKGCYHYPSMHQDLIKHKRYTEIDYLNGYINSKGKEYGLDTPYCDLITRFIHAKEKCLFN